MRILLLNQTFYPDVASTAQHLADLASALSERGHDVTVLTSRRAYDDVTKVYAARETWRSIQIIRVRIAGLGKSALWRRLIDGVSFMAAALLGFPWIKPPEVIVTLTSPPLLSVLASALCRLRGSRLILWVMDLNPDEAIAIGCMKSGSLAAKVMEALSRWSMRSAERVVALDQFMASRIHRKGIPWNRLTIIPPWSHDPHVHFEAAKREEFRRRHELEGRFVVMYSGNHSVCHSLETVLSAARKLRGNPKIKFCFVGGGTEFRKIQKTLGKPGSENLMCLSYQPFDKLSASLSAADIHLVVMGNEMIGIVHPCKVYNLLHIGTPLLYIGPSAGPIAQVVAAARGSACFEHGEVDSVVQFIQSATNASFESVKGNPFPVANHFSKGNLLPEFIELLEQPGGKELTISRFPISSSSLASCPPCPASPLPQGADQK